MEQYTTGEIAQKCGVSVRTVQYYDSRGILVPHELSYGGRRLYDESDIKRLGIITFLRELGFSIDAIKELLADEQSGRVIDSLINEQENRALHELRESQNRMQGLVELRKALHEVRNVDQFDFHAISDAKFIMKNRSSLKKIHGIMLALGFVMDAVEIGTLVYAIHSHNWWPFGIGMAIVVIMAICISVYYFKNTAYLCPNCHTVFRPKLAKALLSAHTPTARKLTCPHCGYHGYCIEVADPEIHAS